jgi:hypothetical protein
MQIMAKVYVYRTKHFISKTICEAFAAGVPNSQLVPPVALLDGEAATYGILRGSHEIINECFEQGRTLYYLDLGYIGRSNHQNGKFDGLYRVTRNAYQCNGFGSYPSDRFTELGVELKPWKRKGKHIVVCPMSYNFSIHRGLDHKKWLKDTVAEIAKFTDKEIIIKPKSSDMTLDEALLDAHIIIGYDTNAMVDAVIAGVPAINLGPSAVSPVALQDLSRIESPIYPDRRQWAYNLTYNQWSLDEMRSGLCWQMLQEQKEETELPQRKREKNV